MIPELGHFALWLALGLALALATLPQLGAARGRSDWIALARPLNAALALAVLAAYAALTWSFVAFDFSVTYVAQHSNSELPLAYRVAAVWGGHEGSLLLWVALLVAWMAAVARFSTQLPEALMARVLAILGALAAGFLLFMLLTSNPFERLIPGLEEGRDLNPLLQDPGMVLHPPMLYMGYVGFAVAYAFAMAALLGGEANSSAWSQWTRWARPWTLAAWISLTLGIALGSWWAYTELGWGGWWFWDPVENASFMPWLVGTALLHSLAVTEKRGAFKSWTVMLAILAFSLSLLGTFLVRSGVLSSVHAFATDPKRGLFILAFLVAVVGGSFSLYAARASKLGLGARFAWLSRETLLLVNNVMLLAAFGAVLLGTLYPLALDALTGQKISVGPPYFDAVFAPLMAPVIFLMVVGPLARWKEDALPSLAKRLRGAAVVSALVAAAHAFGSGALSLGAGLGLLLAWWVLVGSAADLVQRLWPREGLGLMARWAALPRQVLAMQLAHAGVGVFIVGVTLVNSLQVERDVKLAPGEAVTVAGYRFELTALQRIEGANYAGAQGRVRVSQGEKPVAELRPEKRLYRSSEMPMTEAAIDAGWLRDLYVSLGEPVDDGKAWILRVYVKPYIGWIWGGCLLMAWGGWLGASDRRYQREGRQRAAAAAEASALKEQPA
ncbi:cytochrome c-type biogenesis protein CcmF [Inhella inkyongensis]|uniref:Cytochrome c-type biogenesis protein CcmF n=1 Tax=Inhella inkyongensis TaxID=392593 RepID=A0A840S926_9BURK|nr:heme lyase CcmF/NrfE family subunit [Inhella inkyongensis]MBB5205031.1 cytochrome c-type biogenesis protein CcmF [Inhella inkyongensis]